MEIRLSTLKLMGALLLILLFVLLLAGFLSPMLNTISVTPAADPTSSPDGEAITRQHAAAAFAAALYTVDYNDEAAWLADYRSSAYYAVFDTVIRKGLWPLFFDHFTQTTATVKSASLFYEEKAESKGQIWKVDLTLDEEWPASPLQPSNPKSLYGFPWPQGRAVTVYVLVYKNPRTAAWEVYAVLEQVQAENFKAGGY